MCVELQPTYCSRWLRTKIVICTSILYSSQWKKTVQRSNNKTYNLNRCKMQYQPFLCNSLQTKGDSNPSWASDKNPQVHHGHKELQFSYSDDAIPHHNDSDRQGTGRIQGSYLLKIKIRYCQQCNLGRNLIYEVLLLPRSAVITMTNISYDSLNEIDHRAHWPHYPTNHACGESSGLHFFESQCY